MEAVPLTLVAGLHQLIFYGGELVLEALGGGGHRVSGRRAFGALGPLFGLLPDAAQVKDGLSDLRELVAHLQGGGELFVEVLLAGGYARVFD